MPVIRIDLEIDSEVYPELYERLRAIERTASRQERLRQLATSGLLWEMVRLDEAQVARKPASQRVRKAAAWPAPDAGPVTGSGVAPAPRDRSLPPMSPDVPVLQDAVEEVPLPKPPGGGRSTVVELRSEDRAGRDDTADAPPLPPPLKTGVHPQAARSARVKRMLDRGLFKNG